jgi:drug/metabolite transporter (DMT)-like permease
MKLIKKFKKLPPQVSGVCLAVCATIIWSWNFIISRGVHDAIPPVTLSFLRWTVAFAVIFPFSYKFFLRDLEAIKRNYRYILITSFLGVTIFNTLIYIAGHSTEAINLSLIAITTPVFIIIFSRILFKEKISFLNILGIAVTLSGIIMLICRGSLKILLGISFSAGDIWMLSAAVIFAVYSLLVRKKPGDIGMMAFLFSTFGAGLIMLVPFFLYEITSAEPFALSMRVTVSILYIGIFASIGGYFLWSRAVELIGASKAGIIYYSLPMFSTIWAILILGEKVQIVHLISMILIITGIIIATKKN